MSRTVRDAGDAGRPQPDIEGTRAARHHRAGSRAAAALLFSVALHGWLITAPAGSGGLQFGAAAQAQPVESAFLVQMIQPGDAPAAAAAPPAQATALLRPDHTPAPVESARMIAAAGAGPAMSPRPTGASVPARTRHFRSSELDTRPIMMTELNLDDAGIDEQAAGYLLLRLYISETGEVENIAVVVSDAPAPAAERVVGRFRDARFTPGIKDKAPVKSQMLIEVKLKPQPAQ